jgi:hypothetical protein
MGNFFDNAPPLLPPNTKRQRDEAAAIVEIDQRVVRLLWRSSWWFGGVSSNYEINSNRYGGDFMHDVWDCLLASYAPSMACIEGLDGCDSIRLTILPRCKSLFVVRQDHQNLKSEDFALFYLRQGFKNLKMNHQGFWVHRVP